MNTAMKLARNFVNARATATPLKTYPGSFPKNLTEAYEIQDNAISMWNDKIIGWKVGGIGEPWLRQLASSRLLGPIFSKAAFNYEGNSIAMPIYEGGFSAVEAEITAVLKTSSPVEKKSFTLEDTLDLIQDFHCSVEIASSPFPDINKHGPLVTISDFGNNNGIILGPKIESWKKLQLHKWEFTTKINGQMVGSAAPSEINGGPVESVRQALENTAKRNIPLKKGMQILTGAITGIHQAKVGDEIEVLFNDKQVLKCHLIEERTSSIE